MTLTALHAAEQSGGALTSTQLLSPALLPISMDDSSKRACIHSLVGLHSHDTVRSTQKVSNKIRLSTSNRNQAPDKKISLKARFTIRKPGLQAICGKHDTMTPQQAEKKNEEMKKKMKFH